MATGIETKIPKSVKRQAKKAEKAQQELIEFEKKLEESGENSEEADLLEIVDSKEKDTKKSKDDTAPLKDDVDEDAMSVENEENKEKESPDTDPIVNDDLGDPEGDPYKQKYDTLKGKYDAEVPRLSQEVGELKGMIDSLTSQESERETNRLKAENDAQYNLSDDEIEEYGPEMIDLIKKVIGKEIGELKDNVSEKMEKVESNSIEAQLNYACPGWRQINEDTGFIKWLDNVEPMTGVSKKHLLNDAYAAKQIDRVSYFFNEYSKEQGKDAETPVAIQPLEEQVVPSSVKAAPVVERKPTFSSNQIKQIYNDLVRNKRKYTPEKRQQIEKEINAAMQEGRIIG